MEKVSSQSRVTPRSLTAEENVRRGKAADKAAMSKRARMDGLNNGWMNGRADEWMDRLVDR